MSKTNRHPIAKIAGVAGWPVHHSLSPLLHNHWLKSAGINGGYTMFAVHPKEAVHAFKTLKRTSISGLNITIPLKGKAYEAADEVTPEAQKLGVCNLLYKRDDKLIGHNTDIVGFANPLVDNIGHQFLTNNTAVVIGAGGASRAVLGALLDIGVPEIRLVNRTDKRAEDLARHINLPSLYAVPWDEIDHALYGAGLVVNASSAGMKGKEPLNIDLSYVVPGGWVYDLVYTPLDTPLLLQALRSGLNTIGGLDMLIAQARPSFHLLFGETPPLQLDVNRILTQRLIGK